jgi:hypothetical protein
LRDCAECAAQLGSTQKSLLLFRNSACQSAEYWQYQPQESASRGPARWAAAVVAVALLAAVILRQSHVRVAQPTQEMFLKIPYVVPPAPYERTEVVRMDVPVAALIEAGFSMNAAAADSVPADVLIGQDGRPLAVAFPQDKEDKQ